MTNASGWTWYSVIEHPLGTLGLVLIGLTAWGVERLETKAWLGSIPARFVLAAIATVGWTVDRLPHWPARRAATFFDEPNGPEPVRGTLSL